MTNVGKPFVDPSSFSKPDELVVTNLRLDWNVNFNNKIITGGVSLNVRRKQIGVDSLILDTRDLEIHQVTDANTGNSLDYTLHDAQKPLGSKLVIKLPDTTNKTYELTIQYATSPKSTALQWLLPEQTAGKKHPYLFSQCEAIHARSMLPCQDTPSVKMPYSAKVTTPKELTALMSAIGSLQPIESNDLKTYTFTQKIPIPSYLIAIVVGALEHRKISERINVWSEKEFVDKALYEFDEAEIMLKTAEDLVGPYIWGRYDILVLPPSFPFGGMENPCLTFVTPTVLAGDRSLANVIAHEISHSWTGNLVTNNTFEHFWLNEGFTVFLERKIAGRIFGEPHRQFVSISGWKDLKDQVKTLGEQHPFTKLVVNLEGSDPDDAFSCIPYEKGYAFLYYLEQLLGGPSVFEEFLRSYIDEFKFLSIDTDTWKNFLVKYCQKEKRDHLLMDVDWNAWLTHPGMPPLTPQYDPTLQNLCRELSNKWINSSDFTQFHEEDIANFSSQQIQEFLNLLLEHESLPIEKIKALETTYKFNSNTNSEIRYRWIRLCLQNRWEPIIPLAIQFINEQGRMKFVRPIYRALYAWEQSRHLAVETFLNHKDEMMYMTAHCIAKELNL